MKILYFLLMILVNLEGFLTKTSDKQIRTGKILGGLPISITDVPYQVCIKHKLENEENYKFACGGALITRAYVLTSAYCLLTSSNTIFPVSVIRVFAGASSLSGLRLFSDTLWTKIHPQYRSFRRMRLNDIGLIKLLNPFTLSDAVQTITLRQTPINEDTECRISGWGSHALGGQPSDDLTAAEIPIYDRRQCSMIYASHTGYALPAKTICAGYEYAGIDSCTGDSGGPLVCNNVLTGIVSFDSQCGETGFPGIYTEVSQYIAWIESSPGNCGDTLSSFNLCFILIFFTIFLL